MTNKQAIEQLKFDMSMCCFDTITGNINDLDNLNEDNKRAYYSYEVAIKALEKQEPKKVLEDETGIFKMGIYFGICPNCNDKVNEVADNNYCGNCGQRLDWSEIK